MNSSVTCRSCGSGRLEPVLSLGDTPLANSLLRADDLAASEARYPLDVVFCVECALVQLTVSVPPDEMFVDYPYFSSVSDAVTENAQTIAKRMLDECDLEPSSLAMEIASNDGYLLRHYAAAGVPVLGIDPARNIAAVAEANGVPTLSEFFSRELGAALASDGRRADVLHANNVLAHVPDVNGVVAGIAAVLSPNGVAVIETPYVRELVERLEFDTIYHEHLFYYSLTALTALFERNGLRVVDVEAIPIHGGSLRVFVGRADTSTAVVSGAVDEMLATERTLGLDTIDYYRDFASRVTDLCTALNYLLTRLRADGKRIAAYGAAAKGATLCNVAGLGPEMLDFVVDRSPHKQGLYMPGVRLPIVGPEALLEQRPDYVLLLAWNFADEILGQQAEFVRQGGRFVVPVPEPIIVPPITVPRP
jgi:SAM-dependent methyltransferase